jgi:hypothetical protein
MNSEHLRIATVDGMAERTPKRRASSLAAATTPFGWIADGHRLTLVGRIVALFNGRIKRVHVDVDDLAYPPFVRRRMWRLTT